MLCPATIPGYSIHKALSELSGALDPWVVGCYDAAHDRAEVVESAITLTKLLASPGVNALLPAELLRPSL